MSFKKFVSLKEADETQQQTINNDTRKLSGQSFVEIVPFVWNMYLDEYLNSHELDMDALVEKINSDINFKSLTTKIRSEDLTAELAKTEFDQAKAQEIPSEEDEDNKEPITSHLKGNKNEEKYRNTINKTFIKNLKEGLTPVVQGQKLLALDSMKSRASKAQEKDKLIKPEFKDIEKEAGKQESGSVINTKVRMATADYKKRFMFAASEQFNFFAPHSPANMTALFMSAAKNLGDDPQVKKDLETILEKIKAEGIRIGKVSSNEKIKHLKEEYDLYYDLFREVGLNIEKEEDRKKFADIVSKLKTMKENDIKADEKLLHVFNKLKQIETKYPFDMFQDHRAHFVELLLTRENADGKPLTIKGKPVRGVRQSDVLMDSIRRDLSSYFATEPKVMAQVIKESLIGASKYEMVRDRPTHLLYVRAFESGTKKRSNDFGKCWSFAINDEFIAKVVKTNAINVTASFSNEYEKQGTLVRMIFNALSSLSSWASMDSKILSSMETIPGFNESTSLESLLNYLPSAKNMNAKELVEHNRMMELWKMQLEGKEILDEGIKDAWNNWMNKTIIPTIKKVIDYLIHLIRTNFELFVNLIFSLFRPHVTISQARPIDITTL